jgi:DNA-binding NarL/FixJ family response regulator
MIYSDKRILVVEDQRPFLILMRGVLNTMGAQSVVTVQNGEAAVVACKREKFDIIISDLHLGADKKNGFQLLEELRIRKYIKPETVFIIVSADNERPYVLGSIEKQPDDYLIKPFSQAQLNSRISKAYAKKLELKPIYQKVMKGDIDGAIEACRLLIRQGTRYRQSCSHLLTELYWQSKQFLQAEHMLGPLLEHKPLPWVKLAMAKTLYLLERYDDAIELAFQVVQGKNLIVDGHDVIAQSYLGKNMPAEALSAIQKSLKLSPLSIERQFNACEIARANKDYELIKTCALAIWEQSKKSIHRDVAHLMSYIRSILDAAEHSADKKDRNKYQQEANFALHKCRNDEVLSRLDEDFDYDIFEKLVTARMSFIDGKLMNAKRTLAESQHQISLKYENYPIVMAPDSIKVMTDLGEFEEATELLKKLKDSEQQLDKNTEFAVNNSVARSEHAKAIYNHHMEKGKSLYAEGRFKAAYDEFCLSQKVAPVNSGVALELLQCMCKILDTMTKPDHAFIESCRQTYRLVDGVMLNEANQHKLNRLKEELKKHIGIK